MPTTTYTDIHGTKHYGLRAHSVAEQEGGTITVEPIVKRIRVVVRRDAYVNYTTVITGDETLTPEHAAEMAEHAWKHGNTTYKFEEDGITEFDHIDVSPEDCEEVDAEGTPIA